MGRYKDYDRDLKRGGYEGDQRSDDRASRGRPNYYSANSSPASEPVEAIVKMYKADKGFGFVGQDGGGKDVFVHATALERAGLNGLTEGQRVRMKIGEGKKGLEAQTIQLLD